MNTWRRLGFLVFVWLLAVPLPTARAAEHPKPPAKHRPLELPKFTVGQVEAMVREVAPQVERVMERKFKTLPPVILDDTEAVARLLAADLEPMFRKENPGLGEAEIARAALASGRQQAGGILGKYGIRTRELGLLTANLSRMFEEHRIDPSHAPGVLKTIVAHELTHALQAQYMPILDLLAGAKTPDAEAASTAVIEGQAMFVQERVGDALGVGEEAREYARTFSKQKVDPFDISERARVSRQEFTYIEGRRFVEWHFKEGGAAELWETLARPPAMTAMIAFPAAYRPTPFPQPDLRDAFATPAAGFQKKGWTVQQWDVGQIELWALFGPAGKETIDQIAHKTRAGRAMAASPPRGRAALQAVLFALRGKASAPDLLGLFDQPIAAEVEAMKKVRGLQVKKQSHRPWDGIECDAAREYSILLTDSHGQPLLDRRVYLACRGGLLVQVWLDKHRILGKDAKLPTEKEVKTIVEEILAGESRSKGAGE